MSERYEAAVERAARALAEHDGNERVLTGDSDLSRRAAASYRDQAHIAVRSFVTAYRTENAPEEAAAA